MVPTWRLLALLGFALLAPADLPAGGAERRLPVVRRRENGRDPVMIGCSASLRCAPHHSAPVLGPIESDEPLRVLRSWCEPRGGRWLQVQGAAAPCGQPRRGWVPG